jgi:hypothetical protein
MRTEYQKINFRAGSLERIALINSIIGEYRRSGYVLSLRQLYYQLVAAGHIENSERSYKNTGNLVDDGRMAGLIDWAAIEDRTRVLKNERQDSHGAFTIDIESAVMDEISGCFYTSAWAGQPFYCEVWIEKDALSAIVESAARSMGVPYFASRGYSSASAMYEAGQRFKRWRDEGKDCILVYCGDHDPSGLDMTRDIRERLETFGAVLDVQRIALNLDQVKKCSLPPNPAKETDKRYAAYIKEFGGESWELDALKPQVLHDLIVDTVSEYFDQSIRDANLEEMEQHKREQWEKYADIIQFVKEKASGQ